MKMNFNINKKNSMFHVSFSSAVLLSYENLVNKKKT